MKIYNMLYWKCPKCNSVVDFTEAMRQVFSDYTILGDESDFDPEHGLWFHTIICDKCLSTWTVSISDRNDTEEDKPEKECTHTNTESTHPYGWIVCKDCGKLLS